MEPYLPKNPTREQLDRWAHQVSYEGGARLQARRQQQRSPRRSGMRTGAIIFAFRHLRPW